jgi:putative RecB family exonuclease
MFDSDATLRRIEQAKSMRCLSAADINAYLFCGLFYKFSRIDGIEIDPIPDLMVYESAIRKTLTDFNQARMENQKLEQEELQTRFRQHWRDETTGKNISYRLGKSADGLSDEGANLVKTLYGCLDNNNYEVASVKTPFNLEVKGVDVPIIGEIDLIEVNPEGTVIVTDYSMSEQYGSVEHVDDSFHLTILYMGALSIGFPDGDVLLRTDCLINKKAPEIERFYTLRSKVDVRRAKAIVQSIWDGINKESFIPNTNSWKCSSCGYKRHCDKWLNV